MHHLTTRQYAALAGIVAVSLGLGFLGGSRSAARSAAQFGRVSFDGADGQFRARAGGDRAYGGAGGMTQGGRTGGMRQFAGGAGGEVIAVGEGTFTVKLGSGGTRIVLLAKDTAVTKAAPATPSDITVGAQAFVGGEANPDGSVTAKTVQLR